MAYLGSRFSFPRLANGLRPPYTQVPPCVGRYQLIIDLQLTNV